MFVDRKANRPNRYKVTPDSGNEYFVTLERADEPTEMGTPINAETLNKLYGEDNKPTALEIGTMPADNARTTIPNGSDLNSDEFLKIGAWKSTSVSAATSLINCPVTIAFTLDVVSGTGSNNEVLATSGYIIQKLTTNEGDQYFRRIHASTSNGRVFADWSMVYSTKKKPTPSEIGAAPAAAYYVLDKAGTSIPANEDLNNYTTPGIYSAVASVPPTLKNSPITASSGFQMSVEYGYSGNSRIHQTVKLGVDSNYEFTRVCVNGTWSAWKRPITHILTKDDYGTTLPTAGTVGRIFFKKV